MASLTSAINVNVDAKVKEEATAILKDLGLNMSTAINMFLVQVIKKDGIPFEIVNPKPSKDTLRALNEAKEAMQSGKWDMIILDEINYAVDFGLIPLESVLDLINEKPAPLHLVLTGRNAKNELIDRADLVTEMTEIKHPFQQGIKAQKGIEF